MFVLTGFVAMGAKAQNYYEEVQEEVAPAKRIYFGGNLSAQPLGDFKSFDISPIVGYRITPKFSSGVGLSYQYLQRTFRFPGQPDFKISSSLYGGRIFSRYRIDAAYFLHSEFESLNVELGTGVGDATAREWVPGLFIGGGILRPFFANAAINITVLYNVIHDNFKSPYNSAIVIRGGVVL